MASFHDEKENCGKCESQGHYRNLIPAMKLKGHSMFFNYLRMVPSTFDDLLHLVSPLLINRATKYHKPLHSELQMAVALWYIATGESQASLSYNYRIGRSTVCNILDDTS